MTIPNPPLTMRAVVTGGTGAIGRAIAAGLLGVGIEVVLPVRDLEKGARLKAAVQTTDGLGPIIEQCDVSSKSQILSLAERLPEPVHLLINNAAECPRRRLETAAGIERQFAVNVLGYYWMMNAFLPQLALGAPSRIVNVASYWAGGLDLDDLEYRRRPYDNDGAYRQSKQADRMLTVAFAERFRDKKIAVNSCHPGDVRSKLSSDLGFGGHESPEQGAATPLFLALDDIGGVVTGRYFAHLREEPCCFSADRAGIERLYRICGEYD